MKTSKKILIAVGAVVLVAAIVAGILAAVFSFKKDAPELIRENLHKTAINYSQVYVVGQPPYTDNWVFDTKLGMQNYWISTHTGGNGIEFVLQQTKDGELIVLSEALPAQSNAEDLYGKGVKAGDLTLEQLRKINLFYYFKDEDGFMSYAAEDDEALEDLTVVTLEEMFDAFDAPNRTTIRMFLRFYDELQISDMNAALQTIYAGLTAHSLAERAVFLPQSDATAAAADTACPELQRAATTAEAKDLVKACSVGNTPEPNPAYVAIYEKASGKFASENFIHYVRNLGLAIILTDADADDVARYRSYGVTALATSDAPSFIQILQDAKTAERESKKAADSSAQS